MRRGSSNKLRSIALVALTLAASHVARGAAQDKASDRRRFLASDTKTTDDPRRTPIDPTVPRGPDGAIVLRGGRVFDGTGAAARPGTVIITRNIITTVVGPTSTNWRRDARVIDVNGMTVMPGLIDLPKRD